MTRLLGALFAVLALAAPAAAQKFPENNGSPVVDQADILSPEQELDLKSKAEALYARSGRAFAVATVKSLEGYPPEDYAYRLGRYWKLGSAKNDDGVLLLVAPNDRRVAIATGYGAGAYMTDAMSGLIIREAITPHFKQTPPDYGGGIEAGADAIIKQMSLPPELAQKSVAAAGQSQQHRRHSGGGPLPAIFWAMILGFVVLSMFRRSGGRRYRRSGSGISPWVVLWGLNELSRASRRSGGWGGGSWGGGGGWSGGGGSWSGGGGGGFGGFGGGSFGGGGASGSW
ncbi:MAG TPA: TPM domain-containing protein [Sphingomicrobium sp.]